MRTQTTTAQSSIPTPDDSGPLLRVEDLAVSFRGGSGEVVRAVDGVRFSAHAGQTLAIVGESGCGKSVTAMSVLRLLPTPPARYDRGRVLLRGVRGPSEPTDLLTISEKDMRRVRGGQVAMIFQEPMTSLNPVYTVGEQIAEAIMLHQDIGEKDAEELAAEAMTDVGIREARSRLRSYPHQFSGGMRQRVMIAMALACRPRLLLADEPTTALDVTVQAQILELLRSLQESRGMGIVLITHALGVVAQVADVVCVMYAGRVVEYATAPELFARPLHPYSRALLRCAPTLRQRSRRLVTVREVVEDRTQFTRIDGVPGGAGMRPWWPSHDAPPDALPAAGPTGQYVLHEACPGHWVGLWRSQSLEGAPERFPDLAFRRGPRRATPIAV